MNSYNPNHPPIRIEERGSVTVVHLEGSLGIENVAELRGTLNAQLELKRDVCLDLKRAADPDLCGLQLLNSAHTSFRSAGLRFEISGFHAALESFARVAGYDERASEGGLEKKTSPWIAKQLEK